MTQSPEPTPLTALRLRRPKRRLVLIALDWTRKKDLGHASPTNTPIATFAPV